MSIMNMDAIRTFIEIAEVGSFQNAAENLNVTQSTISARVKTLEQSLNRQLFHRRRNGITLTTGGQAFHLHALTMLKTWDLAQQEVALPSDLTSHITLGVQLNHWATIASPWIQWMKQFGPDVATQLRSDYSGNLMKLLRDGEINLAILYEAQRLPGLVVEEYRKENLILADTKPRKVSSEPVPGYVYIDWGKAFQSAHVKAFPNTARYRRLSVGLAAVGLNHVLQEGGSGYFLERDIIDHIKEGRLFPVENAPILDLKLYLVYFQKEAKTQTFQTAFSGLNQLKTIV